MLNFDLLLASYLGLVLSVCALFLSGAGHGTYAPMFGNVSILAFIPALGILLGLFGTPLLWVFYFAMIPAIASRVGRIIALVLVSLLHILPAIWFASEDSAFTRMLEFHSSTVLAYGVALATAILCLAFLTSLESRKRKEYT
jgi:hypothetical protein